MTGAASLQRACRGAAFAAAVLWPSAYAVAQDYQKPLFHYGIGEVALWDQNPLMLRDDASGIYGAQTQAFFGFEHDGPTSRAGADLIVRRSDYDQSEYSSTDFNAKMNVSKTLARWELGFAGKYDFDTTRTSELTTFGRDVGTGRRKSFDISPSVVYALTERSGLGLTGKWLETRYETDSLIDYRLTSLSPVYTYKLSPRQTATLAFQAQRFSLLEDSDSHIDSVGPSAGWSYELNPFWTLDLTLGTLASKVDGYDSDDTDWEHSLIYGGTLHYKDLKNKALLSAIRSRQPYANGTGSLLTTFRLQETYSANERLDVELKADYSFAEEAPVGINNLETAWSGQALIRYALGERWSADASYRYRTEELSNTDGSADQQQVRVGITYKFGSL